MDQTIVADHMKCPICLEVPKNEIFQCLEGHIICSECCSKVSQCPVCRKSFFVAEGKVRNRVLESLIEDMVFKCPHKRLGCEAKLKRVDLSPHAKSCKYQHSNFKLCPKIGYPNCEFFLNSTNIERTLDHFESHGIQVCSGYSSTIRFSRAREFYDFFQRCRSNYPPENVIYTPVVLMPSAEEQEACEQTLPTFLILTTIGSMGQWIGWLCLILEDPRNEMDAKYEIEFVIRKKVGLEDCVPDLQWKLVPVPPHQATKIIAAGPPIRICTSLLQEYYMERQSEALDVVVSVIKKIRVEELKPAPALVETGMIMASTTTMETQNVVFRGRGRASPRITIHRANPNPPSTDDAEMTNFGIRNNPNAFLQPSNPLEEAFFSISPRPQESFGVRGRGRGEVRRPRRSRRP